MSLKQPIVKPQVSILIPVFNKLSLTRQCLQSIQDNTPHDLIEVIIIDNASIDGTSEYLSGWTGPFPLKVIHNKENKGFAQANNQGAQIARGKYLLLLNNDTVPKPNWISPLLSVFDEHKDVGAVGSKLLYPNGTIQHVGVITVKDDARKHPLIPVHLGHRNQDSPSFNKLRRYPAVTGACMMVPKLIYQQVGGLDEFFWNGFEDVDFCFKLLEADLDIFCQPESVVIHYESQSGDQRFVHETENLLELVRRWKDRITCQFALTEDNRMVPNDAVTIVVVTHNSTQTIVDCLEHLNRTIRKKDKVVIVDNASEDQTQTIVQNTVAQKDQYHFISNKKNLGYAKAANIGANATDHPYIIFLDPDTIVTPQWIEKMLFHLMPHKIAAVGPMSNEVNGIQEFALHLPGEKLSSLNLGILQNQLENRYSKRSEHAEKLAGFCLMVKRKLYDSAAGACNGPMPGNDDLDLSQHFLDAGYHQLVAKDTLLYRKRPGSTTSDPVGTTSGLTVTKPLLHIAAGASRQYGAKDVNVSNQFNHLNELDTIIQSNTIDSLALHDAYNQCIKKDLLTEARSMLSDLRNLFPNDRQVQQLHIALCIHKQDYVQAMERIEALIAQCSPDDGLIDAALAVRAKIGSQTETLPTRGRETITLCMIVKNEVAGLGACLNSAKKLVDEIVVVDTGSADRTKDVASIFGARLFEYQWHDNFAAARNFSLDHASGDWILVLDADEIIASKDHNSLRSILKQARHPHVAFSIETRNYSHLANTIGWHANDGSYSQYETGTGWFPSRKVRLFPRIDSIRFRFPVHERVDIDIRKMGIPIVDCPIPVHHYGCLNEVKKQQKAQLYLQLGYEKLDQFSDDLEAMRELAVQAGQLEQWANAIKLWQKFIAIKPDYAEAHVNLAGVFWQIGQYEAALASANAALNIDPNLKEAHYNVAVSLMFMGRISESIDVLIQLLMNHNDYLGARFMLAAALSFSGDEQGSSAELIRCQNSLPHQVISTAVDDLVARLEKSGCEADGRRFRETALQIKSMSSFVNNAPAGPKLQAVY